MNHKEYQLGILLVHGIGVQRSGETLIQWGDALLKTISAATGGKVQVMAGPAEIANDTGSNTETTVHLTAGDMQEKWLMVEGWWAEAFMAPTYMELVSWSFRGLPWTFALHFAQNFRKTFRHEKPVVASLLKVKVIIQFLAAMVLAPIFIALLALVLLVGLIPIPQLRSLLLQIQGVLISTVGDSLAFLESPLRAALIRTKVQNGLKRIKEVCDHTVIIAHSQGAAVVLDNLGGIPEQRNGASLKQPEMFALKPDRLITFGAGINKLGDLKSINNLPKDTRSAAPLMVAALLVMVTIVGFFSASVISGKINMTEILLGVGMYVASLIPVILIMLLAVFVQRKVPKEMKHWVTIILAIVILAFIIAVSHYTDKTNIPFFGINIAFLIAILLISIATLILSEKLGVAITAVENPIGEGQWFDFYSSADPVPNGETKTTQAGMVRSTMVWNMGSTISDHTTYWSNLDCFVLSVLRICSETAGSFWQDLLPGKNTIEVQLKQSRWRVIWLQRSKLIITLASAVNGLAVWLNFKDHIPVFVTLPEWLVIHPNTVRLGEIVAAVVLLSLIGNQLLTLIWKAWVRSEQLDYLNQKEPPEYFGYKMMITMLVWCIVSTGAVLMKTQWGELMEMLHTWESLTGLLIIYGLAAPSIKISQLIWPSPLKSPSPTAKPISSE